MFYNTSNCRNCHFRFKSTPFRMSLRASVKHCHHAYKEASNTDTVNGCSVLLWAIGRHRYSYGRGPRIWRLFIVNCMDDKSICCGFSCRQGLCNLYDTCTCTDFEVIVWVSSCKLNVTKKFCDNIEEIKEVDDTVFQ